MIMGKRKEENVSTDAMLRSHCSFIQWNEINKKTYTFQSHCDTNKRRQQWSTASCDEYQGIICESRAERLLWIANEPTRVVVCACFWCSIRFHYVSQWLCSIQCLPFRWPRFSDTHFAIATLFASNVTYIFGLRLQLLSVCAVCRLWARRRFSFETTFTDSALVASGIACIAVE